MLSLINSLLLLVAVNFVVVEPVSVGFDNQPSLNTALGNDNRSVDLDLDGLLPDLPEIAFYGELTTHTFADIATPVAHTSFYSIRAPPAAILA